MAPATDPSIKTSATVTDGHPRDGDSDFGDFAEDSDDEDEIFMCTEGSNLYEKTENDKIFYPICIGEVVDGRYRIEHKLGHGGYSTVWMAHDLHERKDVALKILAYGNLLWDHDFRMQEIIIRSVRDTSHLTLFERTFVLPNDNHEYRVMVLPLRGPCLDRFALKEKTMATRMSAARQLLQALESLHEAGIVHRDIQDRNCMWGIKQLDNLSRKELYEKVGRPLKDKIPLPLHKRGELVKPLKVPEKLCTGDFYLGDFGISLKLGEPMRIDGYPPLEYSSPDRIHGEAPSFACDMWSYMCIFSELYMSRNPFYIRGKGEVLTSMVHRLGPLPKHWHGKYSIDGQSLDLLYDQDRAPEPGASLADFIGEHRPDADPVEREHILSIMSRGFSYDPQKRPTASQLLRDPSFNAIMNKCCSRHDR